MGMIPFFWVFDSFLTAIQYFDFGLLCDSVLAGYNLLSRFSKLKEN